MSTSTNAGPADDHEAGGHATATGSARVLHSWNVPGTGSDVPLPLVARVGEVTTIVGANGAGKSALGAWLDRNGGPVTHRISGHRHLMIAASGSDMTSASRAEFARYTESWRTAPDAHYVDRIGANAVGMVLFDLLGAVNIVDELAETGQDMSERRVCGSARPPASSPPTPTNAAGPRNPTHSSPHTTAKTPTST